MIKKTILILLLLVFFLGNSSLYAAKKEGPPRGLQQKIAKVLWTQALKTGKSKKGYYPEVASPLIYGEKIFVGTHSGNLYALDANKTKKILWVFQTHEPIASQPIADEHRVFVGNNEGTLFAVNHDDGKEIWHAFLGGEILAQPALDQGILYVVTSSREVYALDASTGQEKWRSYIHGFEKKITMRGNSPVKVDGGRLYIGFADGQIVSLLKDNGNVVWNMNFVKGNPAFKDIDAAVAIEENTLYFVGYFGSLIKMDKSSGSVIWKKDVKSGEDLAMNDQAIYVSSADGRLIAFDKKTGLRHWEKNLNSGALSAPVLVNNLVILGSQLGGVYVFDAEKGSLLQTMNVSSGYLGNAIAKDSRLYFLSGNGKLYALGF